MSKSKMIKIIIPTLLVAFIFIFFQNFTKVTRQVEKIDLKSEMHEP
jgi:hypothetical protein